MLKPLKIGNLEAKLPIVQGGMGVGVSRSSLAGAVAKEGGIGVISAAQIGYDEPDWDTNQLEPHMRALDKHIKRAKEISDGGIIGVNIMAVTNHYEEYVKQCIKSGADMIITGAGLPMELPQAAAGSDIKLVPIVSSKKAANIILKRWDKKHQIAPDAVVIEGPLAGGHLGFKPKELVDIDICAYDDEIKKIMEVVKPYEEKYEKHIPIIVGGGISDKEKMQHYLDLDADGVQIATAFVTTEECDADIRYKEAYINAKEEDIIIVQSPVGLPGRAINNAFMKRVKAEGRIAPKHCHRCMEACNPAETLYCITEGLVNAGKGNVNDALLFCGADAWKADRIKTVKEVIEEFTK